MNTDEAFNQYREGAQGTSSADAKVANRHHDKMMMAKRVLRATPEGRLLIQSLLTDPIAHVRCWAAAHCLEWSPDPAVRALEMLRDAGRECSFDAEMTLKEYFAGRLRFDV